MYKFFSRENDRIELDKVYAMLENPEYAKVVQACSSEFKIFDKEVLAKVFDQYSQTIAAISAKMDSIEQMIKGQ